MPRDYQALTTSAAARKLIGKNILFSSTCCAQVKVASSLEQFNPKICSVLFDVLPPLLRQRHHPIIIALN